MFVCTVLYYFFDVGLGPPIPCHEPFLVIFGQANVRVWRCGVALAWWCWGPSMAYLGCLGLVWCWGSNSCSCLLILLAISETPLYVFLREDHGWNGYHLFQICHSADSYLLWNSQLKLLFKGPYGRSSGIRVFEHRISSVMFSLVLGRVCEWFLLGVTIPWKASLKTGRWFSVL